MDWGGEKGEGRSHFPQCLLAHCWGGGREQKAAIPIVQYLALPRAKLPFQEIFS